MTELITNILLNPDNDELSAHFLSLAAGQSSLREIMEANFFFNLSLTEYAKLCGRGIASFKRDFRKDYGTPPGYWLKKKRLDYATVLLACSVSSKLYFIHNLKKRCAT